MTVYGSGGVSWFAGDSRASVARIYDAALGGEDHNQIDLDAKDALLQVSPGIISEARANRAFLGRAVRYLAEEAGIRQFLDLGSGLPTQNNVHEVAQRVDPAARVVYVDKDPSVLTHGHALLAENASTTVITADMRNPQGILDHPGLRSQLSLERPVAVLFMSVLHSIPDEAEPQRCVSTLLQAFPAGSCLALSHLVSEDETAATAFTEAVREHTEWGRVRSPEEVRGFFRGLDLAEPGLVDVREWRAEEPTAYPAEPGRTIREFGGVAHKPERPAGHRRSR